MFIEGLVLCKALYVIALNFHSCSRQSMIESYETLNTVCDVYLVLNQC